MHCRFVQALPPVHCRPMKRQTGFTLTELMVVLAIVAILLSIGVPSYRYVTNSYRMSAEVNGLLGDLQYARSEAIKEGQTVSTCVSTNGTACAGGANVNGIAVRIREHDPAARPVDVGAAGAGCSVGRNTRADRPGRVRGQRPRHLQ